MAPQSPRWQAIEPLRERKEADMTKRLALVTGGTRGIGAAISTALADAGCTVVATHAGNTAKADAFHAETGIPVYGWDVADFAACRDGVAQVVAAHGPIDILVNNAGITRDATLHKMTEAQWRAVIDTNLGGCFNMCHAVIEGMRARGFGRIVNIGSINGLAGQFGQANYAAAKAGIIGFTKSLAQESAQKGITVNVVAPGYTATDMVAAVPAGILEKIVAKIPVGRLAEAREIAAAVRYLVSEEAAFVTGATLSVNGGQYMA
jgi:acetoacetyl-CoA reductase